MTQTLLYNKLKIRPVIPTLSIPSIDQHQSHHNYCWIRYDTSRTDHCHRCCRHILETPRKTMASLKSWMGLGSTNRYSRHSINSTTRTFVFLRGGSDGNVTITLYPITEDQKYTVRLTDPAPGSPFHYAFPVHDLKLAKEFYVMYYVVPKDDLVPNGKTIPYMDIRLWPIGWATTVMKYRCRVRLFSRKLTLIISFHLI